MEAFARTRNGLEEKAQSPVFQDGDPAADLSDTTSENTNAAAVMFWLLTA